MGTRKKGIFAVLILADLMAAVPGSAVAFITNTQNTAGGGSCVDEFVNPSASGAKITGTLNVDYQYAGDSVPCQDSGESKPGFFLVYTMRVEKGSTLYLFDGMSSSAICVSDCATTMGILNDFVKGTVAPFVYPSLYSSKKPPATAVLKSTTKEVGSIAGTASGPGTPLFPWLMLDFEYAVQ